MNRPLTRSHAPLLPLLLLAIPPLASPAQAETFTVPVDDARVVPVHLAVSEIDVANSKVADVKIMPRNRLLITGRRLGQTRLTFVGRDGKIGHHLVRVTVPTGGLTARLKSILSTQKLTVTAIGDTIVLTGVVNSPLDVERASRIVGAHIKGVGQTAKVINLLTVRGRQQVQLQVKIAEVSRTALRQMGLNAWVRRGVRAGGILAPGTPLNSSTAPDLGQVGNNLQPEGAILAGTKSIPMLNAPFVGNSFGLLFAQSSESLPLSIAVSLLQSKGMAKVLSEPRLVAYSGQQANFLVGGEFPIPIPQALGQTTIEFKKFGVQLAFTPTVLDHEQLRLKVSVAVSERDASGAVVIQGTSVPALSTRLSETTVELKNGHSFAIAGLLQDRVESTNSKIPLLGDIPIVGMLFRRTEFRRSEQELVVLVTAHLVRPLKPGEVPPLPGEDELTDPGALQFFLLGTTDAAAPVKRRRGPAGPVGFAK